MVKDFGFGKGAIPKALDEALVVCVAYFLGTRSYDDAIDALRTLAAPAECAALRAQLDGYQNREAACCEEGVGFDEVIPSLREELARITDYCDHYEQHLTDIAGALGVTLNGSEHQWSEATREILQRLPAPPTQPKP